MRRSLEASLRALRTDQVDILLLHECRPPDVQRDDVLDFLERAKASGSIGAYGIGTDVDTTRVAVAAEGPLAGVVVFASGIFDRNLETVAPSARSIVIAHTALGMRFTRLQAALADDPTLAKDWSDALGIDARDTARLGRLLLLGAMAKHPNGTVLFSSSSAARIAQNASALREALLTQATLNTMNRLAFAWASDPRAQDG